MNSRVQSITSERACDDSDEEGEDSWILMLLAIAVAPFAVLSNPTPWIEPGCKAPGVAL
jgi:hypothetical protein